MKFFSKIGSMVGSNSSSVFSNKQGFPNLMQFSKDFKNAVAPSFRFRTLNPGSFFSRSFIHVTAYY